MLQSVNIAPQNAVHVLDNNQGWISLLRHSGEQVDIVNAARVSFGKMRTQMNDKDKFLLKFLIEQEHFAPLEHQTMTFLVHCPLFVRSQWHRHRCLSGDSELWFTLPSGKNYKMKISEAYRKWTKVTSCKRKDRQKNPIYSKELISRMNLKSVNLESNQFINTQICDIFENGEKETFQVTLSNGFNLKATSDHQFLTDRGWKKLENLTNKDRVATIWSGADEVQYDKPWFFDFQGDIQDEIWKKFEDKYLISSYGRIKTTVNTRNVPLKKYKFRKKTIANNGYPCFSISHNGKNKLVYVHTAMAQAFGIKGDLIRHLDDNKLNCALSNLSDGTDKDNRKDAILNNRISKRKLKYFNVVDIVKCGKEKVYDITVSNEFHNFVANGIVVHNCASYNQISRRYTEVDMQFYLPDNFRKQSEDNKQASIDNTNIENNKQAFDKYSAIVDKCFDTYEQLLKLGVCREQARGILPQNMMTTFYCTMNLRNCLHFLSLRMDAHAQWEIRQYANAIHDILKPIYPNVIEAFDKGLIK